MIPPNTKGAPAKIIINKAANGQKAWVTSLNGKYKNNEQSYLYSPCFDLSGLTQPVLSFAHIFDIDIHSIAARPQRGEPAHEHFDIRVLVEVAHETRAVADDGILGVRWFPLSEVSSINNTPSVTRMVGKTKPVH